MKWEGRSQKIGDRRWKSEERREETEDRIYLIQNSKYILIGLWNKFYFDAKKEEARERRLLKIIENIEVGKLLL
jgi:hypothetical protein